MPHSLLLISSVAGASSSWDGSVEIEQRYFFDTDAATSINISRGQTSAKLEMEFFRDWNNGDDTLTFEPLLRLDSKDDERSHGDIRQLVWSRLSNDWELSVGIGRAFWGVTESQHLVDIINQTDSVENIDGEDKLGQPMVRYQYFHSLGNLDVYALPYFRSRTFPGKDSRLNGDIIINNDNEIFESADEETHVDYAIRYSNTLGGWGIGLSAFDGTSREPDLLRWLDPKTNTTTAYYPQIVQFGADIQLTTDAWLVKLEVINRDFDDRAYQDFVAATVGVEYTFTGLFGSIYDLGMLAEYSWDERGQRATGPFQNDVFVGARLALNDLNSSEILLGAIQDLDDSGSTSLFLEASTRVASALIANVEIRYFESNNSNDFMFGFRDDSFIQVGVQYFFD